MIYFIHKPNENAVKVGHSSDPMRRLATLRTGSPSWLGMLAIIPGTKRDEARIHADLGPHHLRGEWFEEGATIRHFCDCHSPDMVAWIRYADPDGACQWFYKRVDQLGRMEAEAFIAQRFDDGHRNTRILSWLLDHFEANFPGFSKSITVSTG